MRLKLDKVFTRYRFRTIFTILLILWVSVIFVFGTQDGTTSTSVSDKVANWIIEVFNIDTNGLDVEKFKNFVRSSAHFIEYAIMGVLAFLTFISYTRLRYTERIYYPLVICVAVACVDEFIQKLNGTRRGDLRDVAVDGAGALVLILLCAGLTRWIKSLYNLVEFKPRPALLYEGSPILLDDDFIKTSGLKGMTVKDSKDDEKTSEEPNVNLEQSNLEENFEILEETDFDAPEVVEAVVDSPSEDENVVINYIPFDSENDEPSLEESELIFDDLDDSEEASITEESPEPVFDYIEPVEETADVIEEAVPFEETAPIILKTEPVITEEKPILEEPEREEVILEPIKVKKPYPKRFELSEELYYAASVIGKVTVEAARRKNKFAKTAVPTNKNMERIYLTLGKTEYAKMEIVDVLNSDISFEEKINLINKEQKEAYEYFDSIIPQ